MALMKILLLKNKMSYIYIYCYVHPPCFFFFTPSLCPQQHVSGHRVHTGLPGAQAGQQGIGGLRNFHTVRMGKCSEVYL